MTTMLTFEIITQGDRLERWVFESSGSEGGPVAECMDYCQELAEAGFFFQSNDEPNYEWIPPWEIRSVICSVEEWEEEAE